MQLKENDKNIEIKKHVLKLMESKRWVDALNYLDNLGIKTSFYHYQHIAKCATLNQSLLTYISEKAVTERLLVLIGDGLNELSFNEEQTSIIDLKIEPVLNGRVCIYALKITFFYNSVKYVLFEKIFPLHKLDSAKKEIQIYQSKLIDSINVPKFYGSHKHDSFISHYFEFIETHKIELTRNLNQCIQLVINYEAFFLSCYKEVHRFSFRGLEEIWSNTLSIELVETSNNLVPNINTRIHINDFLSDKRLDQFYVKWNTHEDVRPLFKTISFIKSNRSYIQYELSKIPIVLMHQDIDKRNMIIDAHLKVFFIDWEKYSFSRIGGGFFRFYNSKPRLLFLIKTFKLSKKYQLRYSQLLLSILIYEVDWAVSKMQPKYFRKLNFLVDVCKKISLDRIN